MTERFAAGFPFPPTRDQAQAIEAVLIESEFGAPMERLLCGDVGFGKTEIALRATAAAALSGKQAIVVPTTVLARQHLNVFRCCFAESGVRVELLARLTKSAELREIKRGLRDGTVGIVIGTHALAGKDLRFKELASLHVLTMSATPIPRTLQRAIVGPQSLSTLETPQARQMREWLAGWG